MVKLDLIFSIFHIGSLFSTLRYIRRPIQTHTYVHQFYTFGDCCCVHRYLVLREYKETLYGKLFSLISVNNDIKNANVFLLKDVIKAAVKQRKAASDFFLLEVAFSVPHTIDPGQTVLQSASDKVVLAGPGVSVE